MNPPGMDTQDQQDVSARFVRLPSIAERKLGSSYSAPVRLDPRVLDQMQETIKVLSRQYVDTLGRQIHELLPMIQDACNGGPVARGKFYELIHDMRGLAGTFGHPIVGKFAKSLCSYMEKYDFLDQTIIRFHVEAMRDALEQNKPDDRLADATLYSLEQLIDKAAASGLTGLKKQA